MDFSTSEKIERNEDSDKERPSQAERGHEDGHYDCEVKNDIDRGGQENLCRVARCTDQPKSDEQDDDVGILKYVGEILKDDVDGNGSSRRPLPAFEINAD